MSSLSSACPLVGEAVQSLERGEAASRARYCTATAQLLPLLLPVFPNSPGIRSTHRDLFIHTSVSWQGLSWTWDAGEQDTDPVWWVKRARRGVGRQVWGQPGQHPVMPVYRGANGS